MAIIELNLEKPALKRVESVEEERVEAERMGAERNPEETERETETESGGRSRMSRYGRRLAILGGTAAGVAAARRLRRRRKAGQQELEEDWQTAE